jgi:uncharacterized membrane protein YebE (DUF533 family)
VDRTELKLRTEEEQETDRDLTDFSKDFRTEHKVEQAMAKDLWILRIVRIYKNEADILKAYLIKHLLSDSGGVFCLENC